MTFTLRKPPIIESWIRTNMVSAPESEWRWEDVGRLLESYSAELPELEMLPEVTHQPKGVEQGELTGPSYTNTLIAVPRRLRKTNTAPANGSC